MYFDVEKVAKLVVQYAVNVQPDEDVAIDGHIISMDLMRAIYCECINIGAFPQVIILPEGTEEYLYRYGSKKQLEHGDPLKKLVFGAYQNLIGVNDAYNTKRFGVIDPEKIQIANSSPAEVEIMKLFMKRSGSGELKWTIVPYPCQALAQEAEMDLSAYTEAVVKALKIDQPDPIAAWKKLEQEQDQIVNYLDKVKELHIVGEDTDLYINVAGRKWINCCGHKNLPDGEVFTSPVEDGVHGHIRFTYPGIYMGKEVENIFLEVQAGKIVSATATKGQELLDSILKIENANKFGEFAVGTNYGVTKFMKNILFDEKMGGTLHMALGMAMEEAGGKNQCSVHWDILKDMRSENSKIFADNKLIYHAGTWKI